MCYPNVLHCDILFSLFHRLNKWSMFSELKIIAQSIIVLYKINNDNLNIRSLCQISNTNNEDLRYILPMVDEFPYNTLPFLKKL